jgi:hypothetical protein
MKFSVIGNNAAAFGLLQELVSSQQHSLSRCAISGGLAESVAAAALPVQLAANPEEAMLEPSVNAVVVALDDPEEVLRISRAASQAERHVVVFPPLNCSPAFSFELHLVLDESKHSIVPVIGRLSLKERAADAHALTFSASDVQQIILELPVANAANTMAQQTLRGLDLLSACGFQYSQVTALESLAPDGTILSRLVTLNSQPSSEHIAPPATLMLKPSGAASGASPLRVNRADGSVQDLTVVEPPVLLPGIVWLCEHREACSQWMESFSVTLELAEAVAKSLRRRRTVDVHFDSGSERGVFKSQMTAIGCAVLTFMMFGMVGYLIIAQLTTLPNWILHTARILWIAPLVIFLIAQALLPVARERSGEK